MGFMECRGVCEHIKKRYDTDVNSTLSKPNSHEYDTKKKVVY